MKAAAISEGDRLIFKSERREAYGLFERGIVVHRLTFRDGYKVPHVWDEAGRAFTPSDFSRKSDDD